jgi:hypothetical protein
MDVNPYASPQTASKSALVAPAQFGACRSGDLLVVGPNALLPHRCVKCNVPTDGQHLRFRLSWHPPIAFLGLLLGLLPYILFALVTTKRMTVHVGVCPEHKRKRRRGIACGFVGVAGGIGLIIAGAGARDAAAGLLMFAGFILILAAVVYAIIASRIVWPKRITKDRAWLRGVCAEYLAAFPEDTLFTSAGRGR